MRARLVVGNWKLNGNLRANAALLDALVAGWKPRSASGVSLALCVPFPYLAQAESRLRGTAIAWGAQDVSEHAAGAYTGEVSAGMVAEFGSRYAIVGHSERRHGLGESDERVAAKACAAKSAGLIPLVCVGETLEEREAGRTEVVVGRQIGAATSALGERMRDAVVAYEPVWAIGTGRTASPEQAQEVHAFLRGRVAAAGAGGIPLLYGGSVKAANAAALFAMPDVDGGLVGGASLDAREFLAIALALPAAVAKTG